MICSSADVVRISVLVSSDSIRGSATPLTTTSSSRVESAANGDVLHSVSVKALQAITLARALEENARFVTLYSSLVFMGERYSRTPFLKCPA